MHLSLNFSTYGLIVDQEYILHGEWGARYLLSIEK